jgi:hypothetical protein
MHGNMNVELVEEWSDRRAQVARDNPVSQPLNQKSVMDWPGIEPSSSRWETLNEPSEPWHDPGKFTLIFAD